MPNKVTLSIALDLWRSFRSACIAHGTSASQEVTRLMREQLYTWQRESSAFQRHPDTERRSS